MKIYAFEVREDELQDFENVKQAPALQKNICARDFIRMVLGRYRVCAMKCSCKMKKP